ncbi:MAG: hypothetical protein C0401_05955 [Anaerolinea sp.]|nr:hypothetical protein [Anaerolinea sp.]
MTKHNYILFITILSFLVTLSACKAQPTPEYVPEGAERDSITADADIFARHIQDGMETKDFILFSKDFDSAMLNAMTSASFEKLYKQFEGFFPSSSLELINVQKAGDYFAVRYKVTYPEKIVIMRVVVSKTEPRQVSGLWFE